MSKDKVYRIGTGVGPDYKCSKCGLEGHRLWRDSHVMLDDVSLLCAVCAEVGQAKQIAKYARHGDAGATIGDLLPARATPDGDTFWGASSGGVEWWYALPQYADFERQVKQVLREARTPRSVAEEEAALDAERDLRNADFAARHAASIAATAFVVEANSFESSTLWSTWHDKHGIPWEQDILGLSRQIGTLDKRPVCVSIFWARIGRQMVGFLDATSHVVDHEMIDAWVKKTFPNARTNNALNFHNTILDIERLDGCSYRRKAG